MGILIDITSSLAKLLTYLGEVAVKKISHNISKKDFRWWKVTEYIYSSPLTLLECVQIVESVALFY